MGNRLADASNLFPALDEKSLAIRAGVSIQLLSAANCVLLSAQNIL